MPSPDMPSVTLPRDVRMPLLGLGTWQITGVECRDAVRHALEVGYRHVDTATVYRNETEVGRGLRDSGVPRGDVFLTTKIPAEGVGRERQTLESSLSALGTDHVDLWLVHWPPDGGAAPDTWKALLGLRDEGLARAVGVSNYDVALVDELVRETGEAPAVNQVRWAPRLYDQELVDAMRERGVVLEGYSAFKLTDMADPTLVDVAHAHGVTPQQVVLRWHLEHGIVVIPKSTHAERIEANLDVLGFALTDDEVARIDALAR